MTKNIFRTTALLLLTVLASCQNNDWEADFNKGNANEDGVVEFPYSIPDFTEAATRSGSVTEINLLQFDADGGFLGSSAAENINGGTFKAKVSGSTAVIHFISGYDWSGFNERASIGKHENELIPSMQSGDCVYWDRKAIHDFTNPPKAELVRNQIKISVELSDELQAEVTGGKNFSLEGFLVYNYATIGTVAPFYHGVDDPFALTETPTIAAGVNMPSTNSTAMNIEPKYIFESDNHYGNQTSVIVYAGDDTKKYYRIQLIDSNFEFYPVTRNTHFRIVIKDFIPGSVGSATLNEALGAPAVNNLYADIIKESGTISDGSHTLIIEPLTHIVCNPGTGETTQLLEIPVQYIKNGVLSNGDVREPKIIADDDDILSNVSFDAGSGKLFAEVAVVTEGQKTAQVRVIANALSRVVTIVSSEKYSFYPASITAGNGRWWTKDLVFQIPSTIPASYFPLECVVKAQYLTPVGDSRNDLLMENAADGTVSYTYKVTGPGTHTLNFQNSIDHDGEIVTIEHPLFHTAYVGEDVRLMMVNDHYVPRLHDCVALGVGQEAVIKFFVSENILTANGGALELTFTTPNLSPGQDGFTAIDGTFKYTVTQHGYHRVKFVTTVANKDQGAADRNVTLSWNGGSASLTYEYYLTEYVYVNKKVHRSGYTADIAYDRDLWLISSHTVAKQTDTPSPTGECKATNDAKWYDITYYRPFYIIPGARLDHIVRMELRGGTSGTTEDNRARYTVRTLMGTLANSNKIYLTTISDFYQE